MVMRAKFVRKTRVSSRRREIVIAKRRSTTKARSTTLYRLFGSVGTPREEKKRKKTDEKPQERPEKDRRTEEEKSTAKANRKEKKEGDTEIKRQRKGEMSGYECETLKKKVSGHETEELCVINYGASLQKSTLSENEKTRRKKSYLPRMRLTLCHQRKVKSRSDSTSGQSQEKKNDVERIKPGNKSKLDEAHLNGLSEKQRRTSARVNRTRRICTALPDQCP
ncbi:hypothetical protein ACROYT_G001027 [Oculina patagonica]